MNRVVLNSDGSIVADGRAIQTDGLDCLGLMVDLEEGYTLRSYFRMLEQHDQLTKLNRFIAQQMEEYRGSPDEGCRWPEFEALLFTKTVEMVGFPGKPKMEIYTSLVGHGGTGSVGIRGLQLECLLDMPMRFGRLKHIVFGDKVDLFEFETIYTLFEFIDGIAWELSFHGTPKQCQLRR
ncbi:hypothetical protein D3OALGA1CA_1531 [Olavius algarvensis associated proteobacterium Delta 3]|nr:hypothetical protein D3OALGB2SA_332 [Olavius algarvensis associated proteobacterium Delta 3]CAB5102580.1 hypothetical protein D3OALGA1CA_1531 [Olavius algarvensis associated proteobacterium Delta 3]